MSTLRSRSCVACWIVSAALVAACGSAPRLPPALERSLRVAEGLERAGRHADAADAYARTYARCGNQRALCATAMLREADQRARAGEGARARVQYETMASRYPRHRDAPRALRRAAALRLAAGDRTGGRALLERTMRTVPAHGEATRALALYVRSFEDADDLPGALDALRRLERAIGPSALGDNLLLERARLELRRGRPGDAERTLLTLVHDHPYPAGAWDEALWMLADLAEARGDVRAAIRALETMVSVYESAAIVGSYNLPRFDDAELRIARLWLDGLHDPRRAIQSAERLRARYPDSVLRDDSVVLEARAHETAGDHAAACALRGTLRRIDRHSRFLAPGRWPVDCR